jgi:hypothetical protein
MKGKVLVFNEVRLRGSIQGSGGTAPRPGRYAARGREKGLVAEELVWTLWRRENLLLLAGVGTSISWAVQLLAKTLY